MMLSFPSSGALSYLRNVNSTLSLVKCGRSRMGGQPPGESDVHGPGE